jgi:hypothetical protein
MLKKIVNNNGIAKQDLRMNKSVLIWSLIILACSFFCGCGDSSNKYVELGPLPVIPASKTLTLSQQQLVYLDWHSPDVARSRVIEKRIIPGSAVEFDIDFPGISLDCRTINFVSSGEGGRGVLAGADIRGYETFALMFTLVSINGQTVSDQNETVEVGAIIGPTANGNVSDYKPVTLSLAPSEKSKIAKTPMRTVNIYQIGFHACLLDSRSLNPMSNKIVLRIEPVKDAGFVPAQTIVH